MHLILRHSLSGPLGPLIIAAWTLLLAIGAGRTIMAWRHFPMFLGDQGWYLQVGLRVSRGEILLPRGGLGLRAAAGASAGHAVPLAGAGCRVGDGRQRDPGRTFRSAHVRRPAPFAPGRLCAGLHRLCRHRRPVCRGRFDAPAPLHLHPGSGLGRDGKPGPRWRSLYPGNGAVRTGGCWGPGPPPAWRSSASRSTDWWPWAPASP